MLVYYIRGSRFKYSFLQKYSTNSVDLLKFTWRKLEWPCNLFPQRMPVIFTNLTNQGPKSNFLVWMSQLSPSIEKIWNKPRIQPKNCCHDGKRKLDTSVQAVRAIHSIKEKMLVNPECCDNQFKFDSSKPECCDNQFKFDSSKPESVLFTKREFGALSWKNPRTIGM